MKQIELKDLETGKEYIVAFINGVKFIPCIVKVVKEYTVRFVKPNNVTHSPLEDNKEYDITSFYHEYRGYDLFGNKFRMLHCCDTMSECMKYCNNKMIYG